MFEMFKKISLGKFKTNQRLSALYFLVEMKQKLTKLTHWFLANI